MNENPTSNGDTQNEWERKSSVKEGGQSTNVDVNEVSKNSQEG